MIIFESLKKNLIKKSLLFLFAFFIYTLGFGQTNPVQNLEWVSWHDFPNYQYNKYGLSWQEPKTPHNELIGYNIYRENELYRFQTNTSLGCNPDWGYNDCDFLYYKNGAPFTGYVVAVYEGNIESEYVSFEVGGPALDVNDLLLNPIKVFPNPVKDILYFSKEVTNIRLTDISGKTVKEISASGKTVNVANLAKGVYIIAATTKSGETIKRKIIKE